MTAARPRTSLWRKASRSDNNGGACVEVADLDAAIAIRDSKNPSGPVLTIPRDRWIEFITAVKNDEFTP